ncbi:ATP-binding protein [Kiloniella laminariae]|uniref:histidine kinase n=1 Tax=Kiloniella laminariae TaxID=454162 RepID=A0ABT4LJC5_9PROT|nr:PAS domain-containing hybrid sensor histidine kinase/response regulator [Kiloniella laminariae]MCZ4281213.1 ATP-binding protein [Kiloniella laminariae]
MSVSSDGNLKHQTILANCERLVHHSPLGMYSADAEGIFQAANPALMRIFGTDDSDIFYERVIKQGHSIFVDPETRKNFLRQLEQEGEARSKPCQIYKIDGSVQWINESCITLRDSRGKTIAIEGYIEALACAPIHEGSELVPERRFRSIFDQVQNLAVQGYDQNRKVIYWNNASSNLYGYTTDEALGQKLEDLIIPDTLRRSVIKAHNHWLKGGPPIPSGEINLKRKDGKLVPVYSNHVLLTNGQNEQEMYCIDVNLTEVKKVERALRKAKNHAERASRAKTAFLATMSHELRTPLNAIIGFSEAMTQKIYGALGHARYQEYVNDIHASGNHLLRVINDILDLTMIEAGEYYQTPENVDLISTIEHTLRLVQSKNTNHKVTLSTQIQPDCPPIRIDPNSLKQILANLISNAFKFTEYSGNVRVAVNYSEKNGYTIRIEDNGIGMNKAEIEQAFRPFAQIDDSLGRKYGGIGLGLPLSKSLVEISGGALQLKSNPGQGTNVVLRFPENLAVNPNDRKLQKYLR